MESSWSEGDCRDIDDYYKYTDHEDEANVEKRCLAV